LEGEAQVACGGHSMNLSGGTIVEKEATTSDAVRRGRGGAGRFRVTVRPTILIRRFLARRCASNLEVRNMTSRAQSPRRHSDESKARVLA
jgi:hypothetical protein